METLFRTLRIHFRRRWWLQVVVLGLIWVVCDFIARRLSLPLPGGVIGLGLLLLALETRLLSAGWFRRGSSGLLAHLILFFVPAMLAVVNHPELLNSTGLKLLACVLLGTPLVIVGTALVVEIGFRFENARERHDS